MSLTIWDTFTESARKFHSNITEAASLAVMLIHYIFLKKKKKERKKKHLWSFCSCVVAAFR